MTRGPATGDAFGAMLLAALKAGGRPGEVFEVVERDDGHVRVNDSARYFKPSWGRLDDWAYERVRGRVLDVGCGAGRHALELQRRGVSVVGLDPSPGALAVCRQRGVHHLIEGTAEKASSHGSFDTVLLLGNNLGLLSSRERSLPFLESLEALAAPPGAQILATGVGLEPGASAEDSADGAYVRENLARGRLPWQVTMRSRFGNLTTPWFDFLFLRLADLAELTTRSPWRLVEHLEDGPGYAVRLELQAGG